MAFYREPDPELCQGDILQDVPHLHVKPPLRTLRSTTIKGGGQAYIPEEFRPGTPDQRRAGELVPSFCQVALGMLLTYDCDIDHEAKHRLVALIRPLGGIPARDQGIIRANGNFNYFYLPPYSDKLEESYVDLRRISCLAPELVVRERRIASLTDLAKKALYTQLFRYITRYDISDDFSRLIPPPPEQE